MVIIKKLFAFAKDIFVKDRFVEERKSELGIRSKLSMQYIIAFSFLLLSVANVIARSYVMLILTVLGSATNFSFAFLAKKYHNSKLCSVSSIVSCSVLFGFFVVYGGNDGFSCLWVVLLPLIAMVAMNFKTGLIASLFFQVYLIAVFWTPLKDRLPYRYNDQFCLRFPLFFFVTLILGLLFTAFMRATEYNELIHSLKLEQLTAKAQELARTDPLTKLFNRRYAYEEFEKNFTSENQPHCIVMGDIDDFKVINDTYGHEFGDEVLVIFSDYAKNILPQDYLKSRWGGEEFLFAANASIEDVFAKVEEFRKAISSHNFLCNGDIVKITTTFGISEYTDKLGLSKAVSIADKRLYNGKRANKNCTVINDNFQEN